MRANSSSSAGLIPASDRQTLILKALMINQLFQGLKQKRSKDERRVSDFNLNPLFLLFRYFCSRFVFFHVFIIDVIFKSSLNSHLIY